MKIFHRFAGYFATLLLVIMPLTGHTWAAAVDVEISISEQKMLVYVSEKQRHEWQVSTGTANYDTPTGMFKPIRMELQWYSRKYDWAPMPYSIFFLGGYAIHGTDQINQLGIPASHGCVRLHPENAKTLFNLVRSHGMTATTIRIWR